MASSQGFLEVIRRNRATFFVLLLYLLFWYKPGQRQAAAPLRFHDFAKAERSRIAERWMTRC